MTFSITITVPIKGYFKNQILNCHQSTISLVAASCCFTAAVAATATATKNFAAVTTNEIVAGSATTYCFTGMATD